MFLRVLTGPVKDDSSQDFSVVGGIGGFGGLGANAEKVEVVSMGDITTEGSHQGVYWPKL